MPSRGTTLQYVCSKAYLALTYQVSRSLGSDQWRTGRSRDQTILSVKGSNRAANLGWNRCLGHSAIARSPLLHPFFVVPLGGLTSNKANLWSLCCHIEIDRGTMLQSVCSIKASLFPARGTVLQCVCSNGIFSCGILGLFSPSGQSRGYNRGLLVYLPVWFCCRRCFLYLLESSYQRKQEPGPFLTH